MHEASIAISLIETVADLCQKEGYSSIESVRLKVGKAAGILPDALLFAFDVAKAGTPASQAELIIEFESEERFIYCCPDCKSSAIKITRGDEMQIVDMEVN